uniref:Membrane protein n=1 Tax=uncultured bacterium A1Q1_fos_1060 TaxID=1256540 RepID=L7VX63_9BACT|nr:membrane protein [uncultured bacterium A1Q1_fos_1060]
MSPRRLFRIVAVAEAITWAMLLTGMFLKYVTETTEMGVRIGGMIHGVVFIAYCLVTVLVGIDAKWSVKRISLGLASAIPPFFTVWFDLAMEKRGALAHTWRLATAPPQNLFEHLSAWLITKPLQGLGAGVVAVAALTGVALMVGPPVS